MSWLPPLGHEAVLARLRRAAAMGRLAHAFLFAGPSGVGKRRVAQQTAQGLLCELRPHETLNPCGECPACRQVQAGVHPDYLQITRPADRNEFPIETIRELCAALALKPVRGKRRIAVVDDADFLNEESANSFLKMLEEPPPGSLLILVATSEERQLPTILSRCQVLRFQRLTDEEVADILLRLCRADDRNQALRLAALGEGSVEQAMELADPAWQEARRTLFSGLTEAPRGVPQLAKRLGAFIDEAGKESAPRRTRTRHLIRLSIQFYQTALRLRETGKVPLTEEERPWVEAAAQRFDTQILLDVLERCLQADYHNRRFLNQTLTLDAWLDDVAQIAAGVYTPALNVFG